MTNWKTSLGTIMTIIGLVPQAIQYLNLSQVPKWLVMVGLACSAISFIYAGMNAKDKQVTGAGDDARRES